jgi:hypothetical protein
MNPHPRVNLHPRHQVIQPSDPSYRIIALTQRQEVLVDAGDYEWLTQWHWHAWWNTHAKRFYAARNELLPDGKKTTIYMHREITNAPKGLHVDHEDHDSLNNRRYNLRLATCSQNSCNRGVPENNTSGFKGVNWSVRDKAWRAHIKINKKNRALGTFLTAEAAHEAYKKAAVELHGEFACW